MPYRTSSSKRSPGDAFARAVGRALRTTRMMAELTQDELANRAGINRVHLNRIEQGRVKVSLEVLNAICYQLHTPIGHLLMLTPYAISSSGKDAPG